MRIKKRIERWFSAPEDPDKSEHLIRYLLPGEEEDIYIKNSSQETRYIKNEIEDFIPEVVQKTDISQINQKTRIASIVDWKNMFDENGNALKCTDENKIRALKEIEGYSEFIDQCRIQLKKDIKAEREVLEKN